VFRLLYYADAYSWLHEHEGGPVRQDQRVLHGSEPLRPAHRFDVEQHCRTVRTDIGCENDYAASRWSSRPEAAEALVRDSCWRKRLLMSVSLLLISGMTLFAQDAPVFQAEVSQVHVDAEVLTPEGRVLTGLTSRDFRVYDEGTEQRVLACRTDEEPLDIILLIDKSGSMRRAPQKVAAAAHSAFAELRPGDRVALMTFESSGRLVSTFTQDLQLV
jgi:hypothetical protein